MRLSAAQLEAFERDGVIVVDGVCPPEVCAAAVRAIEDFVGKDADDASRWYEAPGLMYHGLVGNNQSQALWETRQQPALHEVFAQLLGTEARVYYAFMAVVPGGGGLGLPWVRPQGTNRQARARVSVILPLSLIHI